MSEAGSAAEPVSGGGELLRAAREAAGIHIASLAVALKVPVSRLEALEAERFDLLPDPPFVRALAGGVCRALKIDPAPVLARLPHQAPRRLDAEVRRIPGRSFRSPSAPPPSLGGSLRRPVVWSVVALLLAAAALLFLPTQRIGAWIASLNDSPSVAVITSPPVGAPVEPAPTSAELPVAAIAPSGPEAATPSGTPPVIPADAPPPAETAAHDVPAPLAATSSLAAPATTATTATPATMGLVAPASSAPVAPTPSSGLVSFVASGDSWVRVTDARGATVLEKRVGPGMPQSASGDLPLTVVVGNAGVTTVRVRGQAFDLSANTRNNVARFEVK